MRESLIKNAFSIICDPLYNTFLSLTGSTTSIQERLRWLLA